MNNEEIQSLVKQLKATGLGEEEIMSVFYETFEKGEMDRKDLETLAEALGYELTDEFKEDPTPDPISNEGEIGEATTKEDLEDAKAIEPGESVEEFKEKIDEAAPVKSEEEGKSEEESTVEEDKEISEEEPEKEDEDKTEEEDWDKAQKMFKI